MDDYLPKPVRSEDLAVMLQRWHNGIPPHGNGEPQEATLVSGDGSKASDEPPVNLELLGEEITGNKESFREFVKLYLLQASDGLTKLREMIRQNLPSEVRHTAHACVDASISFGAARLAGLFRHLEAMGRAQDLGGASFQLTEAEQEYERVASYMNTVTSG